MFKIKERTFLFMVLAGSFVIAPVLVSRAEEPNYTVIKRVPALVEKEIYPCDDCHSSPTDYNPTRRVLTEEHTGKKATHPLNNKDDPNYWCTSCHQTGDHLKLRLFSGRNITFNESYLICLQCHGNYKDEWESGIHGRKTGHWDTKPMVINSCTTCHDPHNPKFKPIHPEPAPNPPRVLQ